MNLYHYSIFFLAVALLMGCAQSDTLETEVYETSASGNKLTKVDVLTTDEADLVVTINPEEKFQTITGFGGSFTESSAYLLNQVSQENRDKVIEAYFGESGAKYSLTRTHINSSDFSLGNYAYVEKNDEDLSTFSLEEDQDDIIPMIKDAMAVSKDGFKIISSPWTAPPWMKDNNDWKGGKLLPQYYETWGKYFSKYITAYQEEGIDIWGITVENEPLGNDSNWDSMHFSPEEMNDLVKNHLGPQLEEDHPEVKILGYDQNRDHEFKKWIDTMYGDETATKYYDGTAVHWYASTYDVFPEALQYAKQAAPEKYLIQTEACADAEIPKWQDDAWYWSKEATDWGWDWAPDDQKHLHPKYVPVYRYARDIIGTLNNHVDGWIDWNMVLNRQGGPNWAQNWCLAPVIVDEENDEVYFTPLFHTMAHFSRYIRPGAERIGHDHTDTNADVMVTAAQNPDGSIAVVVLNQKEENQNLTLNIAGKSATFRIQGKAIQTIVIPA